MTSERDTLLRQWAMLTAIPRYPRKITAGGIVTQLDKAGFTVSKRTIERDLVTLSDIFPIVSDEREKPYGWSWQKEAPAFDLPAMSPLQALTLGMAQQYLQPLLPACLMDSLAPYLRAAEKVLGASGSRNPLADWRQHVAVVPPTQPLLPPTYDEQVIETVHQALLEGRQMEITYRSRAAGETRTYTAHPLGIVQRGPVTYLVATLFDYEDPRSLAMHRIESATALDQVASRPKDFDLQCHIASGAFGFASKGPIRLVARFREDAALHLAETPLSEDQIIMPDPELEGWSRVEATVNDTEQLHWWLMSFGDAVVVLQPSQLRQELHRISSEMTKQYSKP